MRFGNLRDPPRPAVQCRYPILLLHGLFGFVQKRFGIFEARYFPGVVPYLSEAGNIAKAIPVHPWKNIDFRARQIQEAIENDPDLEGQKVNLIAHSMGGLDARYLVSCLDFADRVASIVSIASPHHGSPLADWLVWIPGLCRTFPAIPCLTEKAAVEFNLHTKDSDRVVYLSIPTWTPFWSCCPAMWPSWLALFLKGGQNDGQVTLRSSRWGEVMEVAKADHVQVIGLRYGFNSLNGKSHLDLYGRITEKLADRGL